jgi:hypothetical protein
MPALTMSAARDSARGTEAGLLTAHPVELVFGHAAQHLGRPIGHRGDDDEVAQPLQQVHREPPRVVPGLDDLVDLAEDRRRVPRGERVDRRVEQLDAR